MATAERALVFLRVRINYVIVIADPVNCAEVDTLDDQVAIRSR